MTTRSVVVRMLGALNGQNLPEAGTAAGMRYCARVIRPPFSKLLRVGLRPVLGLALVSPGCKSAEPAPPAQGASKERSTAALVPEAIAAAAEGLAEVPPPSEEAAIAYAADLDPLLDLVPGTDDHFIVMRDPAAALQLFDAFVGTVTPSVLSRFSDEPDVAQARVVVEEVAKLRDALIEAKVDLDEGMVFLEGPGALVYATASEDPSAIKVALKAAGVKDADLPPTCVAPAAMPGFAACGDDAATLGALTPGKHAADFRSAFTSALKGFDIEHGNLLMRLDGPTAPVFAAVATPPGRMHVVVSLAEVGEELGKYVVASKPDALGMLAPGAAFVWGRVSMGAFEEQIGQMPGPAKNVAGTMTGEFFLGGVAGAAGALLMGVDDPFPASGLVSLASLQADAMQAQLPPGSTVEVAPVKVGDSTTQALHVKFGVDEASRKMAEALKLEPSAYGFSAGKYAGALVGATEEAVAGVGTYEPKTPPLPGVPANLADALLRGDVAVAFHLPFDALQSATVRETLQQAIAAAPGEAALDTKTIEAAYDVLSPLSSLSVWMTHPAGERVLHVSAEAFADASTPEGKDALEALGKVVAGADSSETYGALAKAYPGTPRSLRYQTRAGEVDGGVGPAAMSTSFLLGALAGISVPAFTKYIERSKAAGEAAQNAAPMEE